MDSSATPPHAEYDRWIARGKRRAAWWRRCGQIVFYVVGALLACAFAALLIASLIDLGQPRIWGTFTQTDCEPRPRHGCRPVGIWISDDRSIVLDEAYLDGWTDETGTVRASYQPTALLGDRTVHVPALSDAGPWLTGSVLLGWVGYVLYKARSWGDLPALARRATTRVSPARKRV